MKRNLNRSALKKIVEVAALVIIFSFILLVVYFLKWSSPGTVYLTEIGLVTAFVIYSYDWFKKFTYKNLVGKPVGIIKNILIS
jgi:hypothetical protein